MLKIKDNVDLKELEKFGFKQIAKPLITDYFKLYEDHFICICPFSLNITSYKGKISSPFDLYNGFSEIRVTTEDVEDLIKADLVEKVVGNE